MGDVFSQYLEEAKGILLALGARRVRILTDGQGEPYLTFGFSGGTYPALKQALSGLPVTVSDGKAGDRLITVKITPEKIPIAVQIAGYERTIQKEEEELRRERHKCGDWLRKIAAELSEAGNELEEEAKKHDSEEAAEPLALQRWADVALRAAAKTGAAIMEIKELYAGKRIQAFELRRQKTEKNIAAMREEIFTLKAAVKDEN